MVCSYGTRYLMKQVSAVRKEIPGVLAAEDIEHIHRMRVATRRLRSALPLFSLCFSGKKIRRWRRGMRESTQALGEARDADVQIALLKEYIADLKSGRPMRNRSMLPVPMPTRPHPVPYRRNWYDLSIPLRNLMISLRSGLSRAGAYLNRILGEVPPATSGSEERRDLVPGTECILLRKNQERADLQTGIEKAIRRLEKSGVFGEMERDLRRHERKDGEPSGTGREIFAAAFTSVTVRIDELLPFGEFLADPERSREHHAMRIAVKRLRYTLELWRDLFEDDLGTEIDTLKGLQDLLGDLHDCDVWIEYLPRFLEEEGKRCRAFFGDEDHFGSLVPGIEAFLGDRRERRRHLHEIALTTWKDLGFRDFWDRLREKLFVPLSGQKGGLLKVGLMGNISGDSEALRMVLADGRSRGARLFLNAGDTLGSALRSREVVETLMREGIVSVAGDHDLEILEGAPPGGDPRPVVSKATRKFIRSLPVSFRFSFSGKRLLLIHGSPMSPTETLDGGTPEGRLRRIVREAGASIIVSGHAPRPSLKRIGDLLLVNPGSVGRAGGGETGPSYAILEIAPGGAVNVIHHRIGSGPESVIPLPVGDPPGLQGGGMATVERAGD